MDIRRIEFSEMEKPPVSVQEMIAATHDKIQKALAVPPHFFSGVLHEINTLRADNTE